MLSLLLHWPQFQALDHNGALPSQSEGTVCMVISVALKENPQASSQASSCRGVLRPSVLHATLGPVLIVGQTPASWAAEVPTLWESPSIQREENKQANCYMG